MLDTVASYYCLKFQRKLLNQTWQNGENSSFGTNLDPFGPNLGPKSFFHRLYFYYMLEIVESYHSFAVSRKTNEPISTMVKNLVSGSILAPLDQI